MAEPIIEQISQWIRDALDGATDPYETITLRSIRPGMDDWDHDHQNHGDVVIEIEEINTIDGAGTKRKERGTWHLYGIIATLPTDTTLDMVMSRMAETIRRTLMSGNTLGQACAGMAQNINCPTVIYAPGPEVIVTVHVDYWTDYKDPYTATGVIITPGDYGYGTYGSDTYG